MKNHFLITGAQRTGTSSLSCLINSQKKSFCFEHGLSKLSDIKNSQDLNFFNSNFEATLLNQPSVNIKVINKYPINKDKLILRILNNIGDYYKINNVDYTVLPLEAKCFLISLDILFICLPNEIVSNFKNIFSNFNIPTNQIICSSYAKSINYKKNLNLNGNISFIDIGFDKTSIISFNNDHFISLDILPIGGNHITKDISKILNIDEEQSETVKVNLAKDIEIQKNTGKIFLLTDQGSIWRLQR